VISSETNAKIISFFENIEKYYGCTTEITEGLCNHAENFDADYTTWNLSEFILLRSAYRKSGERFMLEGEKMYFEISAALLIDCKQPGRNTFEFVEQYSETVFRITKIRFQYKY
jgi:RAB protein geranylgeranyltransferase component A